jgi:predicted tellurium resistance membrane protein TerC
MAMPQAASRAPRHRAVTHTFPRNRTMEWITDPQAWIALLTLTSLEIVLGIDNIIFISILSGRLPEAQRARARTLGLAAAMATRILLLASLAWLAHLTAELFTVGSHAITARDLVLIVGGLFLLGKATIEVHHNLEGEEHKGGARRRRFRSRPSSRRSWCWTSSSRWTRSSPRSAWPTTCR